MSFFSNLRKDLPILYHMLAGKIGGDTHQERLESFYSAQAQGYDDFRKRLLKGRESLYRKIECPDGGIWMDMGGGTGANLEFIGDRIERFEKIYLVDLSTSLLRMAKERVKARGWKNVEIVEADATKFVPTEGAADVVTFSYSLTMIPDWFSAMEHARNILKPDGKLGVVDFYVSRKYPSEMNRQHGLLRRSFWPLWFATDNVFLSPDHLPWLQQNFKTRHLGEKLVHVPYVPFGKVPIYQFIGNPCKTKP